jgi:NADPH:quinone reductase-like Zn-dependent oxidoreductase
MVAIYGGGYSEKAVLDENAIAAKPPSLNHVHAAAIPLAGQTAWQFAKARGARVLTTVSTDKLEFARSLGADVVIDHKRQHFEDEASDLDMVFDLSTARRASARGSSSRRAVSSFRH